MRTMGNLSSLIPTLLNVNLQLLTLPKILVAVEQTGKKRRRRHDASNATSTPPPHRRSRRLNPTSADDSNENVPSAEELPIFPLKEPWTAFMYYHMEKKT